VERVPVISRNRDGEGSAESWRRLGVEGPSIASIGLDWNAPIALVGDAGRVTGRRLRDVAPETRRDRRVQWFLRIERDRRRRSVGLDERPMCWCRRSVEER